VDLQAESLFSWAGDADGNARLSTQTDDLRIKRAFWVCGLVRILLISCVIASQPFARHGGGSRARADSLRTPEVRGSTRCP
jgi:hypothetical protein